MTALSPPTYSEIRESAAQAALADLRHIQSNPSALPDLELGRFHNNSFRAILLRRFLLSANVPASALEPLSILISSHPEHEEWRRFYYQYAYWQTVHMRMGRTDLWRRLTRGPVILMYHAIGAPDEPASRYILPVRRFAQQMHWLYSSGFKVIQLSDYLQCRAMHTLPPKRSVIMTFDDGYSDFLEQALQILRQYCLPATIFLVSGAVGGTNRWDRQGPTAGRPLLAWEDMEKMRQYGIEFGAHSRSHAYLTMLSRDQVVEEVNGSYEDLSHRLGSHVRSFAYPGGKSDDLCQDIVEQAGFLGACSSHAGVNDPATPSFDLHRVEIQGTFSLERFKMAVIFGQSRGFLSRLRKGD